MDDGALRLRAGGWEAELGPDGVVSDVRLGGDVVLTALMVVVRDDAWGTVPGRVELVSQQADETGFDVRLRAHHRAGEVDFAWDGALLGSPAGIDYRFTGRAGSHFGSNRIGFVALHPLELAGHSVTVLHPDGSCTETAYPVTVSPHQPFLDVAGLSQQLTAGRMYLEFEGDVFETEDQRNWSDASFKTYSRPLDLPFPVRWHAGDQVTQAVRLRVEPAAVRIEPFRSTASSAIATVQLVEPLMMPEVGVVVGPDDDLAQLAGEVADLRPHFLRLDVAARGADLDGADRLEALGALRVPVELAVHVGTAAGPALDRLREVLLRSGVRLSALAVFDAMGPVTTRRAVEAVRRSLRGLVADVPLVVGTDDNLAELNRSPLRVADLGADLATFSLNPGVHDLRSESMLATAAAVPAMVATAAELSGGAVAVGPVTLRQRRNIYRPGLVVDRLGRDAGSVDDRQGTAFAATWLAAVLIALTEAGVRRATFVELSGPRGLVETPGGRRYPIFATLAAVTRATGVSRCDVTPGLDVSAIALTGDRGTTLLLANRGERAVTVRVARTRCERELGPFGTAMITLPPEPVWRKRPIVDTGPERGTS